jgi:hypothetical protein
MTRARAIFWGFAAALAATGSGLGCGSDKQDPGAVFITRYCDIYKPCCVAAGLPGDGAACQAMFASAASPQATYNTTAGEACLSGLQATSGQPGFCEGDVVPPLTCAQAFGGAASVCIQDNDCPAPAAGDARCVSSFVNGVDVRKCQTQIRGALGGMPCVGSVRGDVALYSGTAGDVPDMGYLCYADDGLRCDDGDSGACVALTDVGGPCARSEHCGITAFCDATTGACAPRKPIGADCIDQALECVDGSYCDVASLVCVAQLDIGGACSSHVQCLTGNCPNDTCQPTPPIGANPLCGG